MAWNLNDLKCPFCHDPVKIKIADDAPSEPFEPWPGFVSYPETHIQCWYCKQFNVLVKNQDDDFQIVNIRHAQVRDQYDRAVEKIYDQMAEVEQKLEGQWGTEKQRDAAQTKIDTLDDKLETGWGTEAQREKAQAQIVELQAKLDAPWGTEAQREAAALKLEKLEQNLQDRMNGFDNQREKIEDRMEKVQARREAKHGTAAVVGAIAKAALSGGKKSGCILPALVIPLLLLLAVGALASPDEPDTTQAVISGAVVAPAADALAEKEVLPVTVPGAADNQPAFNQKADTDNNQSWWQWIKVSIGDIANWIVVVGTILGLGFSGFGWVVKQNRKSIPSDNEKLGFNALEEIQKLAAAKDIDGLQKFMHGQHEYWKYGGSDAMKIVSREWQQIRARESELTNSAMDLTDQEETGALKAIQDSAKAARRTLKANLKF